MRIRLQSPLSSLIVVGCFAALAFSPATISAQDQQKTQGGSSIKETYTGTIVYFPGPTVAGRGRMTTRTQPFTLTINCTTPQAEIDRLAGILKSKGQQGLLDEIGKVKCGVFQFGSRVGRDVNVVAVQRMEEGERKITLLFERWLEFFEVRYGTRSRDYPFTFVELYIDEKGKGEGSMIPAAWVRFKGENTIEIENFAAYPARLMGVRQMK